jgi:hypothetical protein
VKSSKRRDRQVWIGDSFKPCPHSIIETLLNYADEPLADVCVACQIRIAEWGTCTGCAKHQRLIRFGSNGNRWCTGQCETAWGVREEKKKKLATKQPTRRVGMHTD